MNRQQFMQAMEFHLRTMDPSERNELLSDYDQHFEQGLQEGKAEETIVFELGQPEELAREALGDRYAAAPPAPNHERVQYAPPPYGSPAMHQGSSAARTLFTSIGLIFLNLILGIPLGAVLWSIWLTIASLSLLMLAPVAAAVDFIYFNHLEMAEIFVAVGVCGIGMLFALAAKWLFNGFAATTAGYIRWNLKTWKGGA